MISARCIRRMRGHLVKKEETGEDNNQLYLRMKGHLVKEEGRISASCTRMTRGHLVKEEEDAGEDISQL